MYLTRYSKPVIAGNVIQPCDALTAAEERNAARIQDADDRAYGALLNDLSEYQTPAPKDSFTAKATYVNCGRGVPMSYDLSEVPSPSRGRARTTRAR